MEHPFNAPILSRRAAILRSLQSVAAVAAAQSIPGRALASAAPINVGMLIPLSGPAALFGASSRNCSELGMLEVNGSGGIDGRPINLIYIDAGRSPAEVTRDVAQAWKSQNIEAFIGMHDSAVRAALIKLFDERVCYIYTPNYEGGACARGLYVLGETPSQLLAPVIPWLASSRKLKRWCLIGNDYVWPRKTNEAARAVIQSAQGWVATEQYVPFGVDDFSPMIKTIAQSDAQAVLITLVGAASVQFNRQFAAAGLHKKIARLGTLIEENTLAGIGAENSENLYSSSGYFASLRTRAAREFQARYTQAYGATAPVLNVLAQSCYEGLRLLAVMGNKAGSLAVPKLEAIAQWQITDGPRGVTVLHARHAIRDVYLAKADGINFDVIKTFEAVRSGQECEVSDS